MIEIKEVTPNMPIWQRREILFKKYDISYDFLYHEYVLRKIPVERMKIKDKDTLDYYCTKIRETIQNIRRLKESKEDDYIANKAMQDLLDMLGPNWEKRVGDLEREIYGYYSKFMDTFEKVKQENEQTKTN